MGLVEAMGPVCRTGGRAIPRGQRLSQGGPAHELAAQLVHAGLECSRRLATETEALWFGEQKVVRLSAAQLVSSHFIQ